MRARVDLRTGCYTGAVQAALAPEVTVLERTRVSLAPAGERLRLEVEADDLATLRATLNSFLGWAHCALEVATNHDREAP